MQKKGILKIVLLTTFIFLLSISALIIPGLSQKLEITVYSVETGQFTSPVRLCVISDLHASLFGNNNTELINAVKSGKPDLILFTGDIFDGERETAPCENLFSGVCDVCPCYFVTGNHEFWAGEKQLDIYIDIVKSYGITVLSAECETLCVNGQKMSLSGVDDPANQLYVVPVHPEMEFEYQLSRLSETLDDECFNILLSHRPSRLKNYSDKGFDLVLSGHAHGGQVRIPFTGFSLFAPGEGMFPKYTSGEYDLNDTKMIVSRGLSTKKEIIPRIYNRPELVFVDLC